MLERLIEPLLSFLAPHLCLGCSQEGEILCSGCIDLLPDVPSAPQPASLKRLQIVTSYEFIAEQLLHEYKFERRYGAHRPIAQALSGLDFPANTLLVPVPTATSRMRMRGHDHTLTITRRLSQLSGLPYTRLLERTGQQRQTGKNRHDRLTQLAGAFELRTHVPEDTPIVLVDDVVTTGATLDACARVLYKAGAKQISAVAFARKE